MTSKLTRATEALWAPLGPNGEPIRARDLWTPLGPYGLGPYGHSLALMGGALIGSLGPYGLGPSPCALGGRALVGPPWAPVGCALVGRTIVGGFPILANSFPR